MGCFLANDFGLQDMIGNLWEWTRSHYIRYPYQKNDGRENRESSETRVVRGGSWRAPHGLARCAARGRNHPVNRYDYIGFRVVLRSPPVR